MIHAALVAYIYIYIYIYIHNINIVRLYIYLYILMFDWYCSSLSSCSCIVRDYCQDANSGLINYLEFRYCTIETGGIALIILSYIILITWLFLLISLLASTADEFFIPSLQYLSKALRLTPAVAGITLLAIGNGAPDVFTAMAATSSGDFTLTLAALLGASICISCFVLGAVLVYHTLFRAVELGLLGLSLCIYLGSTCSTLTSSDQCHQCTSWSCSFDDIVEPCVPCVV